MSRKEAIRVLCQRSGMAQEAVGLIGRNATVDEARVHLAARAQCSPTVLLVMRIAAELERRRILALRVG